MDAAQGHRHADRGIAHARRWRGTAVLAHSSLEQTSTYLNVERSGLRDSMRRIDEIRSRCNPVVSDATIEHPTSYNVTNTANDKATVN